MNTQSRGPVVNIEQDDLFSQNIKQTAEQLEQLRREQEQLAQTQRRLAKLDETKNTMRDGAENGIAKLEQTLRDLAQEKRLMSAEIDELGYMQKTLAEHLAKLKQISPQDWSEQQCEMYAEAAVTAINQAARDYDDAHAHARKMLRAKLDLKQHKLDWSEIGLQLQRNLLLGLAYNLPILLVGIIIILLMLRAS